jgi:hypothetical protein
VKEKGAGEVNVAAAEGATCRAETLDAAARAIAPVISRAVKVGAQERFGFPDRVDVPKPLKCDANSHDQASPRRHESLLQPNAVTWSERRWNAAMRQPTAIA